jgi:hypothetical protein
MRSSDDAQAILGVCWSTGGDEEEGGRCWTRGAPCRQTGPFEALWTERWMAGRGSAAECASMRGGLSDGSCRDGEPCSRRVSWREDSAGGRD